uniref:protein FAM135B-like isoform X2 n=1 Tax=Ciona intestinalis TaxID=7719 RepID=UPI000180C59F|nr:protein FAM135B-like isoform X2 [Ciona intestinalis]|eukprot:XP_002131288.1 protein FAM135B-like isoform X2 [Ciona intestinalis]
MVEDLQATVEIAVDVGKFYNIDIFQRGFYHLTLDLIEPGLNNSKLEVHLLKNKAKSGTSPRLRLNGAVSKTVRVLYKKEEINLCHTFLFRLHKLIDSQNIEECLKSIKYRLKLGLWFCSSDNLCDNFEDNFEEVSKRHVDLHVDHVHGLHAYTMVIFDYCFMAGVELSVHASVVALHQPLTTMLSTATKPGASPTQPVTLETILFRPSTSQTPSLNHEEVHRNLIQTILSIYTCLQEYFNHLLETVPREAKSQNFNSMKKKIEGTLTSLKSLTCADDVVNQANMNLASACSSLLALWSHVLDVVCLNRHVLKHLSITHHENRLERFKSLFFLLKNPKLSNCNEERTSMYTRIAGNIRASPYYNNIPPLSVESPDNDGSVETFPIIFEETFYGEIEPAVEASVPLPQKPNLVNGKEAALTTLDYEQMFSKSGFTDLQEEPSELPSFKSNGALEGNKISLVKSNSCSSGLTKFLGPGYVDAADTLRRTATHGDVVNAFGVSDLTHLNSTTATSTLLSPVDEPEDIQVGHAAQPRTFHPSDHTMVITNSTLEITETESLEEFLQAVNGNEVIEKNPKKLPTPDLWKKETKYMTPLEQNCREKYLLERSKLLKLLSFDGELYCTLPSPLTLSPYLVLNNRYTPYRKERTHLIVMVHGLDGTSNDLRLVRTYLQLGFSSTCKENGQSEGTCDFLMSEANEDDTYADINLMTEKLVDEILQHIRSHYYTKADPKLISFVGHSLGGVLIRSAISHKRLHHLRDRFQTFLTFSTPHCGTVFNNSTLVNTGLWLIQKWKKSECLLQLGIKDKLNLKDSFMYQLSKKPGLEYFKNVLLVASANDRYVPSHSARIEHCTSAFKDKNQGAIYQEMVENLLKPLCEAKVSLRRYHVVHHLARATANTVIGRAAHIAVLDSDVFLQQFILVSALKYFLLP